MTLFLFQAFSAKLNEQKAEVDQFKGETEHKFSKVDGHLKKQKNTVDMQKTEIDTLKSDTAGTSYYLSP